MIELSVLTSKQDTALNIEVKEALLSAPFRQSLIHQVVQAYRAKARAGTSAQKNRSAVRGGGSKPWRQKGTGRARAGTTRGPLWVGGGRAFPCLPRDFSQKVNRKMYRAAKISLLSELFRRKALCVIEDEALHLTEPKTKLLHQTLCSFGLNNNILLIVSDNDKNIELASRNLYRVCLVEVAHLNVWQLARYKQVVVTVSALRKLEEIFG